MTTPLGTGTDETGPGPREVLAACAEGDFRVAYELTEAQRLRLADGGAGVQAETYERMVREAGQALGGITRMQCDHIEAVRDQMLGYLAELDAGDADENFTHGSEEGRSEAGDRSADAGYPARSADDAEHDQTGEGSNDT